MKIAGCSCVGINHVDTLPTEETKKFMSSLMGPNKDAKNSLFRASCLPVSNGKRLMETFQFSSYARNTCVSKCVS